MKTGFQVIRCLGPNRGSPWLTSTTKDLPWARQSQDWAQENPISGTIDPLLQSEHILDLKTVKAL